MSFHLGAPWKEDRGQADFLEDSSPQGLHDTPANARVERTADQSLANSKDICSEVFYFSTQQRY